MTAKPIIEAFFDKPTNTISYLVTDPATRVAAVIDRLSEQPGPVVLCLDTYEVLGLAEAWLRQVFVPALPDKVRVILAGRLPPTAAWTEAPEWQGLFRALPLGPLSDGDAARILARCGVDDVAAQVRSSFIAVLNVQPPA